MSEQTHTGNFLELELNVEVWLADEQIELRRLLTLDQGDSLRLARDPDEPVELMVNGSVVASGELVVVDGKFGFRVKSSKGPDEAARLAESAKTEPIVEQTR